MEKQSTSVKMLNPVLAYYERPHNKRILKNGYKNFELTFKFCKAYFLLSLDNYSPFDYANEIKKKINEMSHSTDEESYFYGIKDIVNKMLGFNAAIEADRTALKRIFFYLSIQINNALWFTKKYDVFDYEATGLYSKKYNLIKREYESFIDESLSVDNDFQGVCSFLSDEFKAYRSAKKGNPLVRFAAEFIGGYIGGYISSALGGDLGSALDLGTQFGSGAESLMDIFTSGSRQEKIQNYESAFNGAVGYIFALKEKLNDKFKDIIDDIQALLNEVYGDITGWMKKGHLHKKNIRILPRELNCVNMNNRAVSKKFKNYDLTVRHLRMNADIGFLRKGDLINCLSEGIKCLLLERCKTHEMKNK